MQPARVRLPSAGKGGNAAGAVVAAAVLLVACSGDGDAPAASPDGAPPGGSPPDAPTVTAEPINPYLADLERPGGWSGIWADDMEWCLTELGWDVSATEDGGGIDWNVVNEGDDEQRQADTHGCSELIGHGEDEYFTEDYLARSYDERVQQAECIRELGYEIGEPPSREVFIEQSQQERIAVYDPLLDLPGDEIEAAQESCPRSPGWELLQQAQEQ